MNRIVILKSLAAAALALGTLVATTATAHARNDVQFSLSVGIPGVHLVSGSGYGYPHKQYAQPAPVYVRPQPVYVQPAPVYVRPRPVYVKPVPVHSWGQQRHHHGHQTNGRGPRGDYDRDGVPNRHDRFPGNPNWR